MPHVSYSVTQRRDERRAARQERKACQSPPADAGQGFETERLFKRVSVLNKIKHLVDSVLGGHPGRRFFGEPVPLPEILFRPGVGQLDYRPRLLDSPHSVEHVKHDSSLHLAIPRMTPDLSLIHISEPTRRT